MNENACGYFRTPSWTRMSAPQPPAPQPQLPPDVRFGELAVALGLLKREHLDAGLAAQAELRAQGQQKLIGEILVNKHWMDLRSVQKVLLDQQRRRRATGVVVAIQDGRKIDHYILQSKLGEGGMGTVYQAWDSLSNRPIALKVLHPKVALQSSFVERFRREARSAGAMNHPNIVAAYGSGEHNGSPYLAMEFVDGENLKMRLRRLGRLPEFEALNVIKETALGLAHAHGLGIIHRDVKPDNILLGKDGSVKIADLGLAKSVEDDQRLTVTGMALGTPHYISPEQARGERDVDQRTDVYSLGATLYHLVSGRVPFEGKNNADIMMKHQTEDLENPQDLVAELSDHTVMLITKMMAKRPDDRYDGCQTVAAEIVRILSGQPPSLAMQKVESSVRPPRHRKRAKAQGGGCMLMLAALAASTAALAGAAWYFC